MSDESPARGYPHEMPRKMIPVVLGIAASIPYAIYTRTAEDFHEYPLYLSLLFAIPFNLFLMPIVWSGYRNRSWRFIATTVVPMPFVIPLTLGYIYYCSGVALLDLLRFATNWMGSRAQFAATTAAFTAGAGVVLFYLRTRMRCVYGLSEMVVGVLVATQRAYGDGQFGIPSDSAFYVAVLTAGIYLVVRGLDNAQQGWASGQDPAARAIQAWIRRNSDDTTSAPQLSPLSPS